MGGRGGGLVISGCAFHGGGFWSCRHGFGIDSRREGGLRKMGDVRGMVKLRRMRSFCTE